MASSSSSSSYYYYSSGYSTSWVIGRVGVLAAVILCAFVQSGSGQYTDDAPGDNFVMQWNKVAIFEHVFLHLAQLTALKGIKDGQSDANPMAVVAYVGYYVLRTFHWENQGTYDLLLQTQLRSLNLTMDEEIKARQYAIEVAVPIVRGRISSSDYLMYPTKEPAPPNGPVGVYQFAPEQVFIFVPYYGIEPFFAKDTRSYIKTIRPPHVPSPSYNVDLKEVREIGALNGSTRTKEQNETLSFHANGLSTTDTFKIWNLIARKVLPSSTSLYDTAYVLTEIAVVVSDGYRAIAGGKVEYFFWRPVTAIRQGDSENKPVKGWTPSITTFPDPEFPGGTAFLAAAGKYAMQSYLGTDNVTFNLTVQIGDRNVTRTYRSFTQYGKEVADWRILCGNHYRSSNEAGIKIADLVSKIVSEKLKLQFK